MLRFLSSSALLILCAALSACAGSIPEATSLVDGATTAAPAGWVGYCNRHREDPACR